jgi:hypothetical protein
LGLFTDENSAAVKKIDATLNRIVRLGVEDKNNGGFLMEKWLEGTG